MTCDLSGSCFYVLVKRFTCRMCVLHLLCHLFYISLPFPSLITFQVAENKTFLLNSGARLWTGKCGVRIPTGLKVQPRGRLCFLFSVYLKSFLGIKRPVREADLPSPLVTMTHQPYRQVAVCSSLNRSIASIHRTVPTSHRVTCISSAP